MISLAVTKNHVVAYWQAWLSRCVKRHAYTNVRLRYLLLINYKAKRFGLNHKFPFFTPPFLLFPWILGWTYFIHTYVHGTTFFKLSCPLQPLIFKTLLTVLPQLWNFTNSVCAFYMYLQTSITFFQSVLRRKGRQSWMKTSAQGSWTRAENAPDRLFHYMVTVG